MIRKYLLTISCHAGTVAIIFHIDFHDTGKPPVKTNPFFSFFFNRRIGGVALNATVDNIDGHPKPRLAILFYIIFRWLPFPAHHTVAGRFWFLVAHPEP